MGRRSRRISRRRSARVSRRRMSRLRVSLRRSRKVSRKRMLGGSDRKRKAYKAAWERKRRRDQGGRLKTKPFTNKNTTPGIVIKNFIEQGILHYLGDYPIENATSMKQMFKALEAYGEPGSGRTLDKQKISNALTDCIKQADNQTDKILLREVLDLFGDSGINTGYSLVGFPHPKDPKDPNDPNDPNDPMGLGDLNPDDLELELELELEEKGTLSPTPSEDPGDGFSVADFGDFGDFEL